MDSMENILQNAHMVNREQGAFSKAKRVFDLFFSFLVGVCVLPILLIAAVCIVIEDPGNPFYVQKRLGLMGKEFTLIKLRSMKVNAEAAGPQWAEKDDPRVTKVGHFIRKTRIDELPQLLNVLAGHMTVIGPRPERAIFVREFSLDIPEFPKRMEVKPGLTGWAQINGGYDIDPKEKLELDLYYIHHANLLLDMKILIDTVKVVFNGDGAR